MTEKVIVIGGTAAGLSAASRAKKKNPALDIMVFERSGYISYGACGLPYYVGGMVKEAEDLVAVSADVMERERGVKILIHHEALEIEPVGKTVRVKNLDSGEITIYAYDKLVIATGAAPVKPEIPGIDTDGIYYLRTVEDGIRLKNAVQSKVKTAAIIGGGFIGLEVAGELAQAGIQVHILEAQPCLLPFLDKGFSEAIMEELSIHGVNVHTDMIVEEILSKNGRAAGIRTRDGNTFEVDGILICTGVAPATGLARAAGLEIGIKGAIVVDDTLLTGNPSIWACGDCVQMKHLITGKPAYIPLGTTANKQGRIAGGNLAGEKEKFNGVLGSMVTKVFDLYIAAAGLSLEQAKQEGYDAFSSIITKYDKASYYEGKKENTICLIVEKRTGRLLGAQGIGSESIAGRINVLVTAITCKMTVQEINELDLVYAPPVAPVYDPILIAASQAMKKVDKEINYGEQNI